MSRVVRSSIRLARTAAVAARGGALRPLAPGAPISAPSVKTFSDAPAPKLVQDGQFARLEVTASGVGILTFDAKEEKVNTLNDRMMDEIQSLMGTIEKDPSIKAVVLTSGKSDFIVGADIGMLDKAKSAAELEKLSAAGQEVMHRLEDLWQKKGKPVVAAVGGNAMGGGLEVALACQYRIASSSPKTKMALPEVMLGLLPGAGGTLRLPRAVGIQQALTMATTGKNIRPDKAKKMGLVHAVADPHALLPAAIQAAEGIADGSFKVPQPKWKGALMTKVLEGNPIGRNVLFGQAEKMIKKKAGPHYPAPLEILNCIKAGVEGGRAAGSKAEAEGFGKLGMTPVSEALRGIFFSQTATKKNPFGKAPKKVEQVGVLGAGLMGAGIAEVSAKAGHRVILKDKFTKGLARGEAQIKGNLDRRVKRRALSAFDRDVILSRVIGIADEMDIEGGLGDNGHDEHSQAAFAKHMASTDVVIEAVFEDLDLKHRVVKEIEPLMRDDAVFATNTSALPIRDIAKAAKKPERVLGMHYFSPVDKMPLLEIITHDGTSKEAAATAVETGYKQGKTVIVVKDVPGFYVNRCLGPFMSEGVALLQEGVPPEKLDNVMKSFGFPVGPVTLTDEVGADVAAHVHSFLSTQLGDRMLGANPAMLQDFLEAGILGRKTGAGYYKYGKGKKGGKTINPEAQAILQKYIKAGSPGANYDDATITSRMMSRFMIEAILCLQDDIIRSPADGDIGAVFGIGFPPFLGGPFRYADMHGADKLLADMDKYAAEIGPQFAAPQLLRDVVAGGKKFHN